MSEPLLRMLAAEPDDRPTMAEVRDELAKLAAGRDGDTTTVLLARTDLRSDPPGRDRTATFVERGAAAASEVFRNLFDDAVATAGGAAEWLREAAHDGHADPTLEYRDVAGGAVSLPNVIDPDWLLTTAPIVVSSSGTSVLPAAYEGAGAGAVSVNVGLRIGRWRARRVGWCRCTITTTFPCWTRCARRAGR